MEVGQIFRLAYLWSSDFDRNRKNSTKVRPACLVIRQRGMLLMFPITTSEPQPGTTGVKRSFEPVSEMECRRANLRYPSYLVLDEFNEILEEDLSDFESLKPAGAFSRTFLKKVARRIRNAILSRKPPRAVPRT